MQGLLLRWFWKIWSTDRYSNKMMMFYNTVKHEFSEEKYLNLDLDASSGKRIGLLRTSCHRYNIETERHGTNGAKL
jgi:hypothetical protein